MKHGEKTKLKILEAGLEMFKNDPARVTAHNISKIIDMSNASIHYHFPGGLKDAVIKYGIEKEDSVLIVTLRSIGHVSVKDFNEKKMKQHIKQVFQSN